MPTPLRNKRALKRVRHVRSALATALSVRNPIFLDNCHMERIHVHWTGGGYFPNAVDLEAYHILIDVNGLYHEGDDPIVSNAAPKWVDYAAHTFNANTNAIGISLCSMADAALLATTPHYEVAWGNFPFTPTQWVALIQACADLCLVYNIKPHPKTLMSHAEVPLNLGIKQKNKWDICALPWNSSFNTPTLVGNELRARVDDELAHRRAAK